MTVTQPSSTSLFRPSSCRHPSATLDVSSCGFSRRNRTLLSLGAPFSSTSLGEKWRLLCRKIKPVPRVDCGERIFLSIPDLVPDVVTASSRQDLPHLLWLFVLLSSELRHDSARGVRWYSGLKAGTGIVPSTIRTSRTVVLCLPPSLLPAPACEPAATCSLWRFMISWCVRKMALN